jgi:hypothetical protein
MNAILIRYRLSQITELRHFLEEPASYLSLYCDMSRILAAELTFLCVYFQANLL